MITLVKVVSKVHGILRTPLFDIVLEKIIFLIEKSRISGSWQAYARQYIDSYRTFSASKKFLVNPASFLKSMAIVLKSPTIEEKGLILIAYNYAFPTFALLFDLNKLSAKYHFVLEPSTARYFMPEILMFKPLSTQVYIETPEPRDEQFINRFFNNFTNIPIAANWWIDDRIFKPAPEADKDFDIIMVSSWLKLKRHKFLFKVISDLKKEGHLLSCVLVGYPIDLNKEDISKMAESLGVLEQITIYEKLDQKAVAKLYQRSRLNLLLSRREGFNRSIIEGFNCNIPCLIRKNFNFGHLYDYINEQTGGYFEDRTLRWDILNTLNNLKQYSPRRWIVEHKMTAQDAALKLEMDIYNKNENSVSVKTSGLHGMEYWNSDDEKKYKKDYEYIMTTLNQPTQKNA